MKTRNKVLLLTLCAVMLVVGSVMGTLAYLTSTQTVNNTFTVGKVVIDLDEAKVNEYGVAVENAERVKENTYKLIPGHTYVKDPTVTVKGGSEESYIRMKVTINKLSELDKIFAPNGAELKDIFTGFNLEKWPLSKTTEANDTITYEFRYVNKVSALTDGEDEDKEPDDVTLEPLFNNLVIPEFITNEMLNGDGKETDSVWSGLKDFKIDVVAEAVQADGFDTAAEAWAATFGA